MKGVSPLLESFDVLGSDGDAGAAVGRVQRCPQVHVVERSCGRPDDVLAGLERDHGDRAGVQVARVLAEDAVAVHNGVFRLESTVEHHGGVIEQGGQLDDPRGVEHRAAIHEVERRHERLTEAVQQPFHPERALEELVEGGVGRVGGVVSCLDLELLRSGLANRDSERVVLGVGLNVHWTLPFL